MKYVRYFLYGVLIIISLFLFDAWQKEQAENSVSEPTAVSTINHQELKHDRKKLRELSSQKIEKSTQEQLIHVTTDVLSVDIDQHNGKIVRAALLNYPEELKREKPFVLLNDNPATFYIAQNGLLKSEEGDEEPRKVQYRAEKKVYNLSPDQKQLEVVLHARTVDGLYLTKTFTFKPDSYVIIVNMKVNNRAQKSWLGHYYMQLSRFYTTPARRGMFGAASFSGIAFSKPQKPYQKVSFAHLQKESLHENIQGGWLSILQHYFLSAWIPNAEEAYHYYSRVTADGVYTVGMVGKEVSVEPKHTISFDSKFYAGPKIADRLEKTAPHLAMTVDYSSITFFSLLSVLIFNMLSYVHKVVGNWGWSIVIITIFIRLLFYKLSVTSYKSMAGMRKLQPKIQQLKDRYKEDKQALSRSIMELYKKERINPLGGCLPILIQIPVFLSLYWVLLESVELRQAPFMFWIQDLSARDAYYILPILMGLSMFIQQKLSPKPPDPTQAKVMMLLPLFLTVLFLNFPSGLVLYWVVNNSLSILQQWYITRKFERGDYNVKKKNKSKKK